jgi:hypothetical protein
MRASLLCVGIGLLLPACGDDNSGGQNDLAGGAHDQAMGSDGGARDQAMNGGDLAGADQSMSMDDLSMSTDQSMSMNDQSVPADQTVGGDLTSSGDLSRPPGDATQSTDLSSTSDLTVPPGDMATLADLTNTGVTCGNMQCPVGQKCCAMVSGGMTNSTCADSCPDGDFSGACDGPENCAGDPCCIQVMNGGSSGSSCTMAPTDCVPMISFNGGGQTRACHVDGDCTSGAPGTQLNLCCTIPQGSAKIHICLNQAFATILGGSCP